MTAQPFAEGDEKGTRTIMNAITSIPLGLSPALPATQRQTSQLLNIALETSHVLAGAVQPDIKDNVEGVEKTTKTQIVIAGSEINGELVSSLSAQLSTVNTDGEAFLRSIYSLCHRTLTYLDFIRQREGLHYPLAQLREEFVQDGFRWEPFYLDFTYHQFATKTITASFATFLGLYLDPLLPGMLRRFTNPLEDSVTPDDLEKNIWHHPSHIGFGAVLALEIFQKPTEYQTLLQQRGCIRAETVITDGALHLGQNYLDGLRNQANPKS